MPVALTGGFSWLFLSAAGIALVAAAVAAFSRSRSVG
jgi:LPXTG-motif cell wall-anchored protein